jgi:formate dehydrogenase subunit gamma
MAHCKRNEASAARRGRSWRRFAILLVVMAVAAMALPLTGYMVTGLNVAQAQEASEDANPRSEYWRAVREGDAGYSAVTGPETGVLIQNGGQNWRQYRNGPVVFYGGLLLIGMFSALLLYHLIIGGQKLEHETGKLMLRWPGFDRVLHWFIAVLFIVLAITGFSLLWGRYVLIPVFGAEGFAAYANIAKPVHDYLAVPFIIAFSVGLLVWFKHNIPKSYDMQWILQGGGYLPNGKHPPAGFANAGHKMLYWTLLLGGIALMVSGWFMLFPNMGFDRGQMQVANIVHAVSSIIMMAFIFVHIYLATIGSPGALQGMVTGYIDEGYAKQHHPLWYDEVKAKAGAGQEVGGGAAPAAGPASPAP